MAAWVKASFIPGTTDDGVDPSDAQSILDFTLRNDRKILFEVHAGFGSKGFGFAFDVHDYLESTVEGRDGWVRLKWVIATIPTLIILFFLAKLAFQFWWWTFWD